MKTTISKIFLLIFSVALLWSNTVFASCTVNTPVATTPMPLLAGNITAGVDLPDGTLLAQQLYNLDYTDTSSQVVVTCTSPGQYVVNYYYTQTPKPLSSWGTGDLAGKVYETGIPGIGVYIRQSSAYTVIVPGSKPLLHTASDLDVCDSTLSSCTASAFEKRWVLDLVKTGPISPGILKGSDLPCIAVHYTNSGNQASNMVENVCMTGAINVIAGTCQTPDVNVPMGNHDISEFNGKGSSLEWVDASIKLTNCSAFYGNGGLPYPSWSSDGANPDTYGNPDNNRLRLRLTPNTSVIDDANGIFSLTSESGAANGFGIQLGYGKANGNVEPVVFSGTKDYAMTLNSTGLSELPLSARYIQTDDQVSPGKANSAVTFIIDYY